MTSADERIRRRLQDLADFGADAAYTVGLGLDAYLAESPPGRMLRNNGRHILVQVATVVEKLPTDFKAEHSDTDWVAIVRMRNLIAHHYDKVNGLLVYSTSPCEGTKLRFDASNYVTGDDEHASATRLHTEAR